MPAAACFPYADGYFRAFVVPSRRRLLPFGSTYQAALQNTRSLAKAVRTW